MARTPHASIIGGSLGGLAIACLLRRGGWHVDIFERVAEPLSGRGAGIVTHPQLLAALRECGATVDSTIGVQVSTRVALDATGQEIGRLSMPQVLTSWSSLYAVLKQQFPAELYHAGASLTRIEQLPDGVRACFADGQQWQGDLLVGADGIRSTVRSQFLPAVVPEYAGYVAWRGLIEEGALSSATHRTLFDKFGFCLPPGEQMLGYPVAGAGNSTQQGERRYNWVWYRPAGGRVLADLLTDESGRSHDVSIPPPLIRRELIARIRADARTLLAPQFSEMVHLTPQPFFQPIYDVESPRLAFGRVALSGDAAFVARPHVGMGVTKAAADAVSMARALRETADVTHALRRYEQERVPAGAAVIMRARHLGAYMQAQLKTADERSMAERYRTAEAVMRETATPEHMWNAIPA